MVLWRRSRRCVQSFYITEADIMIKYCLWSKCDEKRRKDDRGSNLALAMAQKSKKVLLIEGDMRKSSLASFLNVEVPDGAGFSERISHDLESLIFQVPDRSLYLLPNNVAHKRSTEFWDRRDLLNS